jgi:hypothetical protein
MVSVKSVPEESDTCAVCLKSFRIATEKRYVKKLKCGHTFHSCCINEWLHRVQNCPCCREDLRWQPYVIEYIDMILTDRGNLFRLNREQVSYVDLYDS